MYNTCFICLMLFQIRAVISIIQKQWHCIANTCFEHLNSQKLLPKC